MSADSVIVVEALVGAVTAIALMLGMGIKLSLNLRGVTFAALTGAAAIIGAFFYLMAAERERISLVVAVTSLYPLITILLAVIFLQEQLALRHIAGVVCAVTAIVLLSG
ncbi:MAG: hypothetical protein D6719_12575 [Candidatus Dadabacteria bacterium]|nr:MAG: hypothetical protein D6719_12575 [Candidatus Dadabacteria bacterium]